MAGRYELSDPSWQLIEDLVSPPQAMGRPRRDDRQVLNGIPRQGVGRYAALRWIESELEDWKQSIMAMRKLNQ